MMARMFGVTALVMTIAAAGYCYLGVGGAEVPLNSRERRVAAMIDSTSRPQIAEYIQKSDDLGATLREAGVAKPTNVARRIFFVADVSDQDLLGYFNSHSEQFHGRSFEQSRDSVDVLLRAERTREKLDELRNQ